MTNARDINVERLASSFQRAGLSVSPTSTFHSPTSSFGHRSFVAGISSKLLKPFNTEDIRILLLENVNETAQDILNKQGYQVECYKSSLPEDELIEKIRCVCAAISYFVVVVFVSPPPHAPADTTIDKASG
jgi:D-3-phosphoglycerate dehydrogenase